MGENSTKRENKNGNADPQPSQATERLMKGRTAGGEVSVGFASTLTPSSAAVLEPTLVTDDSDQEPARVKCTWASNCHLSAEAHKREFIHPGDSDWTSETPEGERKGAF